MLSDAEVTDARRFLGYAAHGAARSINLGAGFYQASVAVDARVSGLSDAEEGVVRGYLRTLLTLEAAIPGTGKGLDTASAAGWVRNPEELAERERLFDGWRRRLCGFLGVAPGPALARGGGVTLVV